MHDLCKSLYSNLRVKEFETELITKKLMNKKLQPKPLSVPLWAHKTAVTPRTAVTIPRHLDELFSISALEKRDKIFDHRTSINLRND